jgi:hypothetical protein
MKKVMFLAMFAVMLFGTLATGYAEQGDWRGGIRSRIQESRQKIDGGVAAGTLDRREAGRLNGELGAILNKIDRMKSDGQFTERERGQVKNDLDRLDRDIFKEKHDGVVVIAPVQIDWRGGIRSRIEGAKLKIDHGIQAGTLDRHEARKLDKELSRILGRIEGMKSDGRLSLGERNKINRNLDRLDGDIARNTHN